MFVAGGGSWLAGTGSAAHEETLRSYSVAGDARPPPARKQRSTSTRRHGTAMFVTGAEEVMLLRVLQVPPCSSPASGAAMDLQAVAPAASPPTSPMFC